MLNKKMEKFKNYISLPIINPSSKKYFIKPNSQNNLLKSSIKTQKYKLDVKKYQTNINTKKKKFNSLSKECEKLVLDSTQIPMNNNKEPELDIDNEKKDKVENYKEKKYILELSRKEYNTRNEENIRIKYQICIINKEINDIENKIEGRHNDVRNIKYKIEKTEKNIGDLKQFIKENKEKNKKLNYIKLLEKQRFANINKLNEANKIIKNNEDEIIELRRKLEELKKNK